MKQPKVPQPPQPPDPPGRESEDLSSHEEASFAAVCGEKPSFSSDMVFQVQHGVVSAEIEEEFIVGDLLGGRYFRLNSTAAFLWNRIARADRFCDLAAAMEHEYGLEPPVAEQAVSDYLTSAIGNGILASQPGEYWVRREES